jgi:hypothetical protein
MRLLNVRERHLSISHELPIAPALLTTKLLQSMVRGVVAEADHGVVGRRVANLQGALVVGAGQIAQVGGHGAEAAVPSGMLGWSAP